MPMVATSPSMRSHSWSEVNSVVMMILWLLPSALVGVGNEGGGGDATREPLGPDLGENLRADGGERSGQIAHCDRRVQARAEPARRDRADLLGRGCICKQRRTLAHGGAALRLQADA